jgi:hypothetical protein
MKQYMTALLADLLDTEAGESSENVLTAETLLALRHAR